MRLPIARCDRGHVWIAVTRCDCGGDDLFLKDIETETEVSGIEVEVSIHVLDIAGLPFGRIIARDGRGWNTELGLANKVFAREAFIYLTSCWFRLVADEARLATKKKVR